MKIYCLLNYMSAIAVPVMAIAISGCSSLNGTEGESLKATSDWSFTPGGQPMPVDEGMGSVQVIDMASDRYGNTMVVWSEDRSATVATEPLILFARYYDTNRGWGEATVIGQPDPGDIYVDTYDIKVAMDNEGRAYAVWLADLREHRERKNFHAAHYKVGTGWSTPELIAETYSRYRLPDFDIVASDAGTAMLAWDSTDAVDVISYRPESGWEPSISVQKRVSRPSYPKLSMDSAGNAFLDHRDPVTTNTGFVRRYDAHLGWGAEKTDFIMQPSDIHFQANGDAMAVGIKGAAEGYEVWTRSFSVLSGWSAEYERVVFSDDVLSNARLVLDDGGNAMASWKSGTRSATGRDYNLWGSQEEVGQLFSSPLR